MRLQTCIARQCITCHSHFLCRASDSIGTPVSLIPPASLIRAAVPKRLPESRRPPACASLAPRDDVDAHDRLVHQFSRSAMFKQQPCSHQCASWSTMDWMWWLNGINNEMVELP